MSSSTKIVYAFILLLLCSIILFSSGQNIPTTSLTPAGASVQVGSARQVAQTGSISITTIFTVGANTAQFHITGSIYCNTAVSTATAALTITYTDSSSTVQTITPTAAACTTLGAASFNNINAVVTAKNGTLIRYSTTAVNAPNYDVRVQVHQLSTN